MTPLGSDPLRYYRRNLELMLAVSPTIGAIHVAVLQPTVLLSNSEGLAYRRPFIEGLRASSQRFDYWAEKEVLYREADATFAQLALQSDDGHRILVRNYSHLLDREQEPSYIDQAHYTVSANNIISDALLKDLRETVLAP